MIKQECTLVRGKYVIPLTMDHSIPFNFIDAEGKPLIVRYTQFAYELGGVRTFQKVQGLTTDRNTMNLNPRTQGIRTNICHRSVFVGMSRVKMLEHFRIVPLHDGDRSVLNYMLKFSMDPKVRILPQCYNENGEWIATTADIVRMFDENQIEWRPKGKKGYPLSEELLAINRKWPNQTLNAQVTNKLDITNTSSSSTTSTPLLQSKKRPKTAFLSETNKKQRGTQWKRQPHSSPTEDFTAARRLIYSNSPVSDASYPITSSPSSSSSLFSSAPHQNNTNNTQTVQRTPIYGLPTILPPNWIPTHRNSDEQSRKRRRDPSPSPAPVSTPISTRVMTSSSSSLSSSSSSSSPSSSSSTSTSSSSSCFGPLN